MDNLDMIEEMIDRIRNTVKFLLKSAMWVIVWQTLNTIFIVILFFMIWGLHK